MPTEDVRGVGRGFLGMMQQEHMRLFHSAASLAMIAVRARRHHVRPQMLAAQVTRQHMVHRQPAVVSAAILAGIIIAPENLPARQFHMRARSAHLQLEPDHGRAGDQFRYRVDITATVHHHPGFTGQQQSNRSARGTYMDGFEVCVKHQDRFVHSSTATGMIIMPLGLIRKLGRENAQMPCFYH